MTLKVLFTAVANAIERVGSFKYGRRVEMVWRFFRRLGLLSIETTVEIFCPVIRIGLNEYVSLHCIAGGRSLGQLLP